METKVIDDGGPAFPNEEIAMVRQGWPGMSLRAYFAGQAMQGLLANSEGSAYENPDGTTCKFLAEVQKAIAACSVGYADALIAALAAGGTK